MMNCIAVDDEPLALKLLQDNITKVSYLNLVGTCANAFEAVTALQKTSVDLIFIDIQMPGLSGMQFVSSLEKKPMVIFITAYKQHALESYDLAAVDYLVKPVSLDRFMKACHRAKELYDLKFLKFSGANTITSDFMFVTMDYSQVKLNFAEIILIEGLRDYLKIQLSSSKKPMILRSSLKAIELVLPAGQFIRVHKSYLLSVRHITAIRKNSIFIDNLELPIGETYREAVNRLTGNNS